MRTYRVAEMRGRRRKEGGGELKACESKEMKAARGKKKKKKNLQLLQKTDFDMWVLCHSFHYKQLNLD